MYMLASATFPRQRAAVAATAALLLLALALVAVSSAPAVGADVELEQLKAASQQSAHRVYAYSCPVLCARACLYSLVSRYHGTSMPQSAGAAPNNEQNYLKSVFDSKLSKARAPSHGDFSAAVAKEARNGILKVCPQPTNLSVSP